MVGQHVDLRAEFIAVDRVGPVSSPDRLRERHHAELIDILNALRRRIRDVIAVGTPAQRKELIEAIVADIRIDGGTVYPIFGLPQDDENLADTISTRDMSHRFAQWWGGWGSNPRLADYEKHGPLVYLTDVCGERVVTRADRGIETARRVQHNGRVLMKVTPGADRCSPAPCAERSGSLRFAPRFQDAVP
jgi:hypothetical protein